MKILRYVLGFIIIIITILLILIALGFINFSQHHPHNINCLTMNKLRGKFEQFKLDNGTLPSTQEGMQALIKNPNPNKYPNYPIRPYLQKIKQDPWRNPFIYVNNNNEIEIISYASDRKKGGVNFAKDILLSECKK